MIICVYFQLLYSVPLLHMLVLASTMLVLLPWACNITSLPTLSTLGKHGSVQSCIDFPILDIAYQYVCIVCRLLRLVGIFLNLLLHLCIY